MPLALLMLMWLVPQLAQCLAQLDRAEQVQRVAGLAGCMRLNTALLNLAQLVGRDAVLDRAVLVVEVVILYWSVPLIGPIACNRRAA